MCLVYVKPYSIQSCLHNTDIFFSLLSALKVFFLIMIIILISNNDDDIIYILFFKLALVDGLGFLKLHVYCVIDSLRFVCQIDSSQKMSEIRLDFFTCTCADFATEVVLETLTEPSFLIFSSDISNVSFFKLIAS